MKQFHYFCLFVLLTMACDTIQPPFVQSDASLCGDDNLPVPIRKVLIEDYTGHTCGNCPRAAAELLKIQQTYCDHIIPMAVHVGFFAQPLIGQKYNADYRTNAGNELNDFFGNDNAGLPNGLVNRKPTGNKNYILSPEAWATHVSILLKSPPEAVIEINNRYDTTTRELTVENKIVFLSNKTEQYSLVVYLTEDSIVSWQKDYSLENQDIPNYVHRHMLRMSLNGTWGEPLNQQSINKETTFTRIYNTTLPRNYIAKHCSIVAFVCNTNTKEVLQAESKLIF